LTKVAFFFMKKFIYKGGSAGGGGGTGRPWGLTGSFKGREVIS
jgi:hypothetical protein